ncbi:MAG TPA: YiiX/YebB-like N1pC/P60 family cysteine hydrolase [Sandaracinaceae bacterium LLY-WYZ-13_1]|nr:YiiX/YebB-like N1pC/P60 family cysteine hydrolase [Sandaracinaceae bacterium LLY-WYZ-13_1]
MSRRRKVLAGGALLLVVLGGALFWPAGAPASVASAGHRPFVWGQDALWERLEADFDRARDSGCDPAAVDAGLAALRERVAAIEEGSVAPDDPRLAALEDTLFSVAPEVGACPARLEAFAARVARLRAAVKARSERWPMTDRAARDRLYRLLYGSRAALEELMLQAPAAHVPALTHAPSPVPSATPSVELHGVTLHSGDILASRGGAPTSAFISRGNDYPGNFSHIALLHVAEDGTPTVLESHIESGVGTSTAERYLEDTKLRIMVLRLRPDHPALADDPLLPHRAATAALEAARAGHVPYDFAMDYENPATQFCSEVAYAAYRAEGVELWRSLSSMSGEGLARWLAAFGVTHFETLAPSDLEYDPQVRVVAEWRDPETLFSDHVDNAILDAMLEGAEAGDPIEHDAARLPLARVAKAYSATLNLFGAVGPIPEGMSAVTALRVEWLRRRHGAIRERLEARVHAYREAHGRRPPYWTLVRMAREARR